MGWMIEHLPAELLQEMCWPSSRVHGQELSCSKTTLALSTLHHLFWLARCNFCSNAQHSHSHLWSGSLWEECPICPRTPYNITFHADKVCLNSVLQGDPLWCQCIDYYLVSGVMCATHISSPVMIQSRNSLPPSCYRCRNVSADSMCFALCSGVSFFGTRLVHNFLNNRCSVTILCNKEREICRIWLLSSIIVKTRFSIMHSCTSSTRSFIMMDRLPLRSSSCTCCWPAVNCLHQWCTICLTMLLGP